MANSSTFQYRFDPGILGDHEAMIELQAEGALWAAQQSMESFGVYASIPRYAALVLEEPTIWPPTSEANGAGGIIGSLFGAKPRKACRCRCLPPDENIPSPDAIYPDPCDIVDSPDIALKRIYMHPLYVTSKENEGAGSDETIAIGDIVWVDRESKTILGLCSKATTPSGNNGSAPGCAVDLAALIGEGGVPVGSNGNPAGIPPFEPYVPSSKLPDYSHLENSIDAGVIETFMKDNGHLWFEEDYQLNIVGVQNSEAGPPPNLTNLFDDFFTVTYKVNGETQFKIWPCTTRPGMTWLLGNPQKNGTLKPLNDAGVAFMPTHKTAVRQPGYRVRKHISYEAVGTNSPYPGVTFRDANWDTQYAEINQQQKNVGLNLHRSSGTGTSTLVNKYSGGCQVFANVGHFMEFMTLARKHEEIWGGGYDSTLGYTLVSSAELPAGWNP